MIQLASANWQLMKTQLHNRAAMDEWKLQIGNPKLPAIFSLCFW